MRKNTEALIIISVILIILFAYTAPIMEVVSDIYDVDNDGDIDIQDVQYIFVNIGTGDSIYDVDEDGDVDIQDVQKTFINIGNDPEETGNETVIEWAFDVEWS